MRPTQPPAHLHAYAAQLGVMLQPVPALLVTMLFPEALANDVQPLQALPQAGGQVQRHLGDDPQTLQPRELLQPRRHHICGM